MTGQCVAAVYPSQSAAEKAKKELLREGISENNIRMSQKETGKTGAEISGKRDYQERGLFEWLFGSDVTDEDRAMYEREIGQGRTALSVYLMENDFARAERVESILEKFDPIEVHEEGTGFAGPAGTGLGDPARAGGREQPGVTATTPEIDRTGMSGQKAGRASGKRQTGKAEEVIPLAKEELEVGKREIERRHLIRTHVVERPVEADVHLRDERVVIERRPASGTVAPGEIPAEGREYEIIEKHQEPVVGKRMRAEEEVVVHKEQQDRVERVRDTVKETRVDVDTEGRPGGMPKGRPGTTRGGRN